MKWHKILVFDHVFRSYVVTQRSLCNRCIMHVLVVWVLLCLGGRYIAKTLYGEEDEDEDPEKSINVEEPKLLGTHPQSGEKVLDKENIWLVNHSIYYCFRWDFLYYIFRLSWIIMNLFVVTGSFEERSLWVLCAVWWRQERIFTQTDVHFSG